MYLKWLNMYILNLIVDLLFLLLTISPQTMVETYS